MEVYRSRGRTKWHLSVYFQPHCCVVVPQTGEVMLVEDNIFGTPEDSQQPTATETNQVETVVPLELRISAREKLNPLRKSPADVVVTLLPQSFLQEKDDSDYVENFLQYLRTGTFPNFHKSTQSYRLKHMNIFCCKSSP